MKGEGEGSLASREACLGGSGGASRKGAWQGRSGSCDRSTGHVEKGATT